MSKNFFEKVFKLDYIHRCKIFEIIQYGVLYFVIGLFTGIGLDTIFPDLDTNKAKYIIAGECLLQSLAAALLVFYIRRMVQLIPLLFCDRKKFMIQMNVHNGEIMLALIFFSTQIHLINKLSWLATYKTSQSL